MTGLPLLLAFLLGASGGKAESEPFAGFLSPANATDVHAPEGSFRVGGWTSDWGSLSVVELAPDGAPVKAGEVVARFDFRASQARNWLTERLQSAEAEAEKSKLASEQLLEALEVDLRRKELEARRAGLELEKERALSRRQAELDRISKRIADFEVEAVKERLAAARRTADAERRFHQAAVKRARDNFGRYEFYERRTILRAPHDGVVRHAFNPRERRKVQKGDSLTPGMRVCLVAKDATLAVRFFVPEHRLAEVRPGSRVTAVTVGAAEELSAAVKSVDFFPQERGFLLENPALPDAREKAFAVVATLEDAGKATAGTEVRVTR